MTAVHDFQQEFKGLIARRDEAQQALRRANDSANLSGSMSSSLYHPGRARLEIAFQRAELAIQHGGEFFNLHAPDLEEIRAFAEKELTAARDTFATLEQALAPVPLLAGFDAASIAAHVAAHETRAQTEAAQEAERLALQTHLGIVVAAVEKATRLLFSHRKSSGMPPAVPVLQRTLLDPNGQHSIGGSINTPVNSAQCQKYLDSISAQRVAPAKNGLTSHESRIQEMKRSLAEFESRAADERAIAKAKEDDAKWFEQNLPGSDPEARAKVANQLRERAAKGLKS